MRGSPWARDARRSSSAWTSCTSASPESAIRTPTARRTSCSGRQSSSRPMGRSVHIICPFLSARVSVCPRPPAPPPSGTVPLEHGVGACAAQIMQLPHPTTHIPTICCRRRCCIFETAGGTSVAFGYAAQKSQETVSQCQCQHAIDRQKMLSRCETQGLCPLLTNADFRRHG